TEVPVRGTTLDVLVGEDSVDVLKIDVQGAEQLVLQGGRAVLARVGVLLIEVSFLGGDPAELLDSLRHEFGSPTVVNLVHGGADLACHRPPSSDGGSGEPSAT